MASSTFGDYEKVRVNPLPSRPSQTRPEARWWRELEQPHLSHELGPVTSCEYQPGGAASAMAKRDLLVTCSTRLLLVDFYTQRVKKQFTRFSSTAYSGTFRGDGRVVAAGSDTGVVQLFSADQSRDVLRQMHHSRNGKPVQCVRCWCLC